MLKAKAIAALRWSAIEQIVSQILFFGISVTMARLVAPEAYGTVALLQFFTGLAAVFVDGGLSAALVQRKDTTKKDESTVFWFNLVVGALMAGLLFFSSPWISRFYAIPVLEPITRIYALQFLLGACNSVQNTLFQKRLDFKSPLKVTFLATVGSAAIGIGLAAIGCGVWALVAQASAAAVLQTAIVWRLSRWRPAFVFSFRSFKSLFAFSGYLFVSGLIDNAYTRIYTLIIGKLFGVLELGLYNRAYSTRQLPTGILTGLLSRVAFPIFSQAGDDLERLRRGLRIAVRNVMLINLPMMCGIAVVADPLVRVLFGANWMGAVSLLRILALGGVLWPLHVLNLSVLQAMGHSKLFFRVELVKKALGITLVVLGARWGIEGMAWAVVASSVVSFGINTFYSGRLLDYGAWRQTRDFLPGALCAGAMAAGVWLLASVCTPAPPVQLALLCTAGVGLYAGMVCALRIPEGVNALHQARRLLTDRQTLKVPLL